MSLSRIALFSGLLFGAIAAAGTMQLRAEDGDDRARKDMIIVLAAERMENFDWQSDQRVKAAVQRQIQRAKGTPEFLELIKRFKPDGMETELLELASKNGDNSTGVEAVGLLLQSENGRQSVRKNLADDETATQLAGLLGLLGNQPAIRLLTPVIADAERAYDVRAAATRTLASNNLGADALMDLAEKGDLPGDVKLLAAGIISRSPDRKVRQRGSSVLPLPTRTDQAPLPAVDQLAGMRGDVARGKELFRTKATCANCHVVGDSGKEVGPNLSEIGDKLSREAMFISILDPSAGISHNYENYICLLSTGQVVTGVMVSETEDHVTLRTAEAIDRKIDRDDIETLKKSDKSIMPENLHHSFDTQGLIDVVEYLITLRKKA